MDRRERDLDEAWYGGEENEGGLGHQANDLFQSYADQEVLIQEQELKK